MKHTSHSSLTVSAILKGAVCFILHSLAWGCGLIVPVLWSVVCLCVDKKRKYWYPSVKSIWSCSMLVWTILNLACNTNEINKWVLGWCKQYWGMLVCCGIIYPLDWYFMLYSRMFYLYGVCQDVGGRKPSSQESLYIVHWMDVLRGTNVQLTWWPAEWRLEETGQWYSCILI